MLTYNSLFKKVAPFLLNIITMPFLPVQIICLCYNSPMYSRLIPGGASAGRGWSFVTCCRWGLYKRQVVILSNAKLAKYLLTQQAEES